MAELFRLVKYYNLPRHYGYVMIFVDDYSVPVVPHKAVAEVSKIGNL